MSILVGRDTRVLVQGLTGKQGTFHGSQMLRYGTNIVAGATPGRGGILFQDKIPVFDRVDDAVRETSPNVSLIFVPAAGAVDAILEAADSGIPLVICITEGVPSLDMVQVLPYLKKRNVRLIGPNCPGVISPGYNCRVGIMPSDIHMKGSVGVVSRSGTLTYEAVHQLTQLGIGQSTCVGIGGDPLIGSTFVDILGLFESDSDTKGVVLIGEIGGTREQEAAEFIKSGGFTKPLVSLVVGQTAPTGKRMGHAGAIITGSGALASAKNEALADAGAAIVPTPADIGVTVQKVLNGVLG